MPPKFGATGRCPQGKAGPDDEGELTMGCVCDHQNSIVRLVFGKPIAWLGLPSQEARALAQMLTDHADKLDRRKS